MREIKVCKQVACICTTCHLHKSSFCKFLKGGEKGSAAMAAVAADDTKAVLKYKGMGT